MHPKRIAASPHVFRCAPVRLDALVPEGENELTWIQVARTGTFLGHPSGPFEFTKDVFDNIVNNFHRHPAYVPGGGGRGVVQFDFHHASEQPANNGTIGVVGAPAQAWAHELEVRPEPGGFGLWSLTRYLEPAKSYVREGKYQWTSVAVWPDAVDPVTAANIGWYLSSIAFTNDPFIQGMVPIAATRGVFASYLDPYDRADSAEDLVCGLKKIFGLTELASLGDVLGQIAQLRSMSVAGGAPPGVEVGELVGQMRCLFNLPVLTSTDLVFAEADKLLAALAEVSTSMTGSSATKTVNAARAAGDRTMKELLALFAGRLRVAEAEEDVKKAFTLAMDDAAGAMKQIEALCAALGVPDPSAASAKIAELLKSHDALLEAMPQLAALKEQKAVAEDEAMDGEVDKAMAAHRMPEAARKALKLYRKTDPAAFALEYPLPKESEMYLTRPLATDEPKGNVLGGRVFNAQGSRVVMQPLTAAAKPGEGNGQVIDLDAYAGRNITEKAMSYVKQNGGEGMDFNTLHARASALVASAKRA